MALEVRGTACCGVGELHMISSHKDPAEAIDTFCEKHFLTIQLNPGTDRLNLNRAFYTFTQAQNESFRKLNGPYGVVLKEFIEANDLGDVFQSNVGINPNTNNEITVFIWKPKRPSLTKWYEKRPRYKSAMANIEAQAAALKRAQEAAIEAARQRQTALVAERTRRVETERAARAAATPPPTTPPPARATATNAYSEAADSITGRPRRRTGG